MHSRIALLFTVIVISLIVAQPQPIAAQSTNPACKPGDVIAKAAKLKASGTAKVDMIALYALAQDITNMDIACNGMTFKGHGNKVLNPITLPAALYKVSVKTKGAFILEGVSISGSQCDVGQKSLIINDMNPNFEGDQTLVSESTLPIDNDCRVVLTISNNSNDWVLTLLPIQ